MGKPPILANYINEAEPAVRAAAEWLAGQLTFGSLTKFYACNPFIHTVHESGRADDPWQEGAWGAVIQTPATISMGGMADLQDELDYQFGGRISLDDVDVEPCRRGGGLGLLLICTLSARLADGPEPDSDDCCEICGASLSLARGIVGDDVVDTEPGCPACLPCGGMYAPGTEECQLCGYSDFCAEAHANL